MVKSGLWSFSVEKAIGSVRLYDFSSLTMSLNSSAIFVAMCSCACLKDLVTFSVSNFVLSLGCIS